MRRYLIYLFLILLIIFRYFSTRPVYKDGDLVRISAKLQSAPTYYENYQSINLMGLRINLPLDKRISYGDHIVIEGEVEEGKLKKPKVVSISEDVGFLSRFRNSILSFYIRYLPSDHAALVAGTVIGDKSNISGEFWEKLRNTGTAHVVVASGMNVTFVAGFLISLFTLVFKRSIAIPFVILGIFIYSLLSGFQAPIIRAAIMGGIVFLAQETGRLYLPWRALLITAATMLVWKPDWLVDLGFILSFVATASLLLFQKRIESRLKFVPRIIRGDLATTLAAQIGVTPIIFVSFGQFNLFSPLINVLVLWTIPLIMFIGSASALFSFLSQTFASWILYLLYPLTSWFIFVVTKFG